MNNIYITGFMSSGKTTVSKVLSVISSRELYDTDLMIEEKLNMNISEIFYKYGEEYFRKLETEVLQELSRKENAIVSTGGGIVLNGYNREIMKKTGIIVCLMPDFSVIESRLDTARITRPLLKQETSKIKTMYDNRMEYYKDCTFMITPEIDTNSEEIAEKINILIDHVFREG